MFMELGIGNVVLVDRKELLVGEQWMNSEQAIMAEKTNKYDERGTLQEIIKGKDIFIGVSASNIVQQKWLALWLRMLLSLQWQTSARNCRWLKVMLELWQLVGQIFQIKLIMYLFFQNI